MNKPPSAHTLAIFDEFISRLQSKKINGDKLYKNFNKWINKE